MNSMKEIYARETILMKKFPKQVPVIIQAFRLRFSDRRATLWNICWNRIRYQDEKPFKTNFDNFYGQWIFDLLQKLKNEPI